MTNTDGLHWIVVFIITCAVLVCIKDSDQDLDDKTLQALSSSLLFSSGRKQDFF